MVERRTAAVAILLGAAFVLTAALTWQAVDAARSQARTRMAAQVAARSGQQYPHGITHVKPRPC